MKKIKFLLLAFVLSFLTVSFAGEGDLVIDDFECAITGGPEGTVDFGSGNGSSLELSSAADIKQFNTMSLKVAYNAVAGGYMWIARGFGLDAQNAAWLVKPEDIKWDEYKAISVYIYGGNSNAKVAFDIKDSGNEIWRFTFTDDFTGWKQVVCPFDKFVVRDDWQPQDAESNFAMDFPIKSYQFEPLPESKGVLYFDKVELIKK